MVKGVPELSELARGKWLVSSTPPSTRSDVILAVRRRIGKVSDGSLDPLAGFALAGWTFV